MKALDLLFSGILITYISAAPQPNDVDIGKAFLKEVDNYVKQAKNENKHHQSGPTSNLKTTTNDKNEVVEILQSFLKAELANGARAHEKPVGGDDTHNKFIDTLISHYFKDEVKKPEGTDKKQQTKNLRADEQDKKESQTTTTASSKNEVQDILLGLLHQDKSSSNKQSTTQNLKAWDTSKSVGENLDDGVKKVKNFGEGLIDGIESFWGKITGRKDGLYHHQNLRAEEVKEDKSKEKSAGDHIEETAVKVGTDFISLIEKAINGHKKTNQYRNLRTENDEEYYEDQYRHGKSHLPERHHQRHRSSNHHSSRHNKYNLRTQQNSRAYENYDQRATETSGNGSSKKGVLWHKLRAVKN